MAETNTKTSQENSAENADLSLRTHWQQIVLCWLWFFLVLLSYYCLKPVRDGLASSLAGSLGNLYLATFLTSIVGLSIYSRLIAICNRLWLLIGVYNFFVGCLLVFFFLFLSNTQQPTTVITIFFVWVSVLNIFVVTLFWSVMADVFTPSQGKAWFGIIAAAGSVGSITGSAVATQLSQWVGNKGLVIVSAIALELAVVIGWALLRLNANRKPNTQTSSATSDNSGGTGGSILAGLTRVLQSPYLIGICLCVALGKFAGTFVYNNLQALLEVEMPDANNRTTLFAQINLYAQSGSLVMQALIAGLIMRWLGVAAALVLPCVTMLGFFLWLSQAPVLNTLIVGQAGQQILAYGLLVPAQHVLFTVVSREDKYKSKGFTDIVVFRGSDVAAGKTCDWMIGSQIALGTLAIAMLPVVVLWGAVAAWTGLQYAKRARPVASDV